MRKISILLLALSLTACSGDKSPTVASVMQKNDKYMSCTEIKLEMNEAQFYEKTADNNKDFKVKYILMPLGYVSTYVNAEDAKDTAKSRVDYLQSVYDILGCEQKERQMLTGPAGYVTPENNGYAPTAGYAPASGNSYNAPAAPVHYQRANGGDQNSYAPQRITGGYGEPL